MVAPAWVTPSMAILVARELQITRNVESTSHGMASVDRLRVGLAQAMLSMPDLLFINCTRWPAGHWQDKALELIRVWHEHGLLGVLAHASRKDADHVTEDFTPEEAHLLRIGAMSREHRRVPRTIVCAMPEGQTKLIPEETWTLVDEDNGCFKPVWSPSIIPVDDEDALIIANDKRMSQYVSPKASGDNSGLQTKILSYVMEGETIQCL